MTPARCHGSVITTFDSHRHRASNDGTMARTTVVHMAMRGVWPTHRIALIFFSIGSSGAYFRSCIKVMPKKPEVEEPEQPSIYEQFFGPKGQEEAADPKNPEPEALMASYRKHCPCRERCFVV